MVVDSSGEFHIVISMASLLSFAVPRFAKAGAASVIGALKQG